MNQKKTNLLLAFLVVALCCDRALLLGRSQSRVIEILADHDSRYKMPGQKQPMITVKAGEEITLRITAKKAENHNRDGSIHGFTLLRSKDRKPVPGWDLLLKPGTQEFSLAAPSEPGEYVVICTVICGPDHEQNEHEICRRTVIPIGECIPNFRKQEVRKNDKDATIIFGGGDLGERDYK